MSNEEIVVPKGRSKDSASRNFLARVVAAAEEDAETEKKFDGEEAARERHSGHKHPVVTPLTPGEEKLWTEYGACYRRLNNSRK